VCWRAQASLDAAPVVELTDIARGLGKGRGLVLAEPGAAAIGWIGRDAGLSDEECQHLSAQLDDRGLRLAVSDAQAGVSGFVRTRQQAVSAAGVARLSGQRIVRYRDVALAALLLRDRDGAAAFAVEELGELASAGATAEILRATLAAFYEAGYDQSEAARELGVHRNTVARRLARAEAVIGHPLSERVPELQAALKIVTHVPVA
jgi:sugar diacid utilization regulator